MNVRLANKKATTLKRVLRSQKMSDSLGNFYFNDCNKNRGDEIDTLYLVSYDFQRLNKDPTGFKKRSQYNKPSFCSLVRFKNMKNKCWSLEN